MAYALIHLSQQARRENQLEQAEAMLEESHVLFRQSGSRIGQRAALMNLAGINIERSAFVRSAAVARESSRAVP